MKKTKEELTPYEELERSRQNPLFNDVDSDPVECLYRIADLLRFFQEVGFVPTKGTDATGRVQGGFYWLILFMETTVRQATFDIQGRLNEK